MRKDTICSRLFIIILLIVSVQGCSNISSARYSSVTRGRRRLGLTNNIPENPENLTKLPSREEDIDYFSDYIDRLHALEMVKVAVRCFEAKEYYSAQVLLREAVKIFPQNDTLIYALFHLWSNGEVSTKEEIDSLRKKALAAESTIERMIKRAGLVTSDSK